MHFLDLDSSFVLFSLSTWTNTSQQKFLRNFGYEAFVHIDKENKTNLEDKSKRCIFVGYGVDYFGYYLWYYENHKIIRTRDVVFNENVIYKDQLQGKKEEKENTEYAVLDEIKENEIPKAPKNQERGSRYLKLLQL